jgi:NAD(P)-dependent dehydrogenase (short-subunit alcohol dehydrogenase family)
MTLLAGKVCIVTGGAGSIGLETARLLVEECAFVLASDQSSFTSGTTLMVDGGMSV